MANIVPYRLPRYGTSTVDRVNLLVMLRRYLKMFRQRWWIPLITFVIGSSAAIYYAVTAPDVYRAVSKLGIAPRISFSSRATDRAVVIEEMKDFAANQLQFMMGNTVLAKVEERTQDFRLPDGTVPTKKLSVSQGQGSTFMMFVDSNSFDYAQKYARLWAREFLTFKEEMRIELARGKIDQRNADIAKQEERVAAARAAIDDYIGVHQIAIADDTGRAAQLLLSDLQRRQQQVMLERQRLEMRSAEDIAQGHEEARPANALEAADASQLTRAGSGAGELGARQDSADPLEKFRGTSEYRALKLGLRRDEAELERQKSILKPAHPYMIRFTKRIEDTKRAMKHVLDIIEEMRLAQVASMKQEEAALEKQIAAAKEEVARLREVAREYTKLNEDYAGGKRQLDDLSRELHALEQIQPSEEMIARLEEGGGSPTPVAPNRPRIIIIGCLGGLFAGLAIIFLLHRLDDRVDSAETLEKALEEPVLGQIPLVGKRESKDGVLSIEHMQGDNVFAEAFRGVRSSVMFGDLGGAKQVIVVTSSVPGDGKTTFTVNFAETLAKAGNRVLLIDADMRRGSVAGYFGLNNEPGLSDVLQGLEHWTDVLNATSLRTLLVITCGRRTANPGELMLSRTTRSLIEEARREFDYVIFDSPPVLGMDDTLSLAASCDGLLFVYRMAETSLKLARHAVAAARQRGSRILGLILNGVTLRSPDYYYQAYYYSHYGYGAAKAKGKGAPDAEEGGAIPRPQGARLLAELREAEGPAPNTAARAALLDDDESSPPAVEVTATPVSESTTSETTGDTTA